MPGPLGTQLRIVLHFLFKEMPQGGSVVFLKQKQHKTKKQLEAAGLSQAGRKGRAGMLPWLRVEPLGELT